MAPAGWRLLVVAGASCVPAPGGDRVGAGAQPGAEHVHQQVGAARVDAGLVGVAGGAGGLLGVVGLVGEQAVDVQGLGGTQQRVQPGHAVGLGLEPHPAVAHGAGMGGRGRRGVGVVRGAAQLARERGRGDVAATAKQVGFDLPCHHARRCRAARGPGPWRRPG